jgi:integrase
MAHVDLRYVVSIRDRHGNLLWYFRKRHCPSVRLPGLPGSAAFMAAYQAALAALDAPAAIGAARTPDGTVGHVVGLFLASPGFAAWAPETRRTRRAVLERFRETHGKTLMAAVTKRDVQRLVDSKRGKPSAARNLLNYLRLLFAYARHEGFIVDDPTIGVTRPPIRTRGYETWSEEHIARFEAAHPPGTRAGLALALLLGTGQRRSDIVKMGWANIRGGRICFRQSTTGKPLTLPVIHDLLAAIEATPRDRGTFLATSDGRPLKPESFTNWLRECCAKAGLPRGLSAHGLRKATCRRLAEAGATANEIMAVSGHNTMSEAARYTAAADQEHLACAAFERMGDLPCDPPVFMGHARLHTLIWGAPGTKIMLPADVGQPVPRYTNSVGANNRKKPNKRGFVVGPAGLEPATKRL